MTQPAPPNDDTLPALPVPRARRRAPHDALALALAFLALAVAGWQWYESRTRVASLQQELAARLSAADTALAESRALAQQNQEQLTGAYARLGAVEAKLADWQSQQLALEAMYQELSRNPDERVLVEVEQAVVLASQQLSLGGNVHAALVALQSADARLAGFAAGQFAGLRRAIARDIDRLKALPALDLQGLVLRLDGLVAAADALPLAFVGSPHAAAAAPVRVPANALQAFGAELWAEIRDLVHVERLHRPDPGLIAPEHAYFLRENLKLRLLNARLALLQRHGRVFREDIALVRDWLERYFDTAQPAVANALATLEPMVKAPLEIELPSLGESLTAVRALRLGRDRPRAAAASR